MPRLTYGPSQAGVVVALADVPVTITSITGNTVVLNVASFDPVTQVFPNTLYAAYFSSTPSLSLTPDQALALAVSAGSVSIGAPGSFTITVGSLPPGTYFVQVFAKFAV